jgi:hypothetical protein
MTADLRHRRMVSHSNGELIFLVYDGNIDEERKATVVGDENLKDRS